MHYRITDMETLRPIARLSISQQEFQLSGVEVEESFRNREAYQQGHLTDRRARRLDCSVAVESGSTCAGRFFAEA